jgi:hypothetical protein
MVLVHDIGPFNTAPIWEELEEVEIDTAGYLLIHNDAFIKLNVEPFELSLSA